VPKKIASHAANKILYFQTHRSTVWGSARLAQKSERLGKGTDKGAFVTCDRKPRRRQKAGFVGSVNRVV